MEYEFDIDINELLSIRRSHCMTDASCQTDMESDLTDSSCQTDTVCDPTDSSCQTDMESDPTDSSCQTDLTARTNTVVAHEAMFTDEIIPTVHIDAQSFPPITSAGKVRDPESQCPDDHEKAFQSEVETFWLQEKSVMEAKAQQKAKIVSREWQQDGVTLQTAVKLALEEHADLYEKAESLRLQFEFEKEKLRSEFATQMSEFRMEQQAFQRLTMQQQAQAARPTYSSWTPIPAGVTAGQSPHQRQHCQGLEYDIYDMGDPSNDLHTDSVPQKRLSDDFELVSPTSGGDIEKTNFRIKRQKPFQTPVKPVGTMRTSASSASSEVDGDYVACKKAVADSST